MDIWIVQCHVEYEGSFFIAAFLYEKEAEEYAEEMNVKNGKKYSEYAVEQVTLGRPTD